MTVLEKPHLIKTKSKCWKCKRPIEVVAIGVRNLKDEISKKIIEGPFLFMHVNSMSENLLSEIKHHHPFYNSVYSKTMDNFYYVNQCDKCNSNQGDFRLHSGPDVAFLPTATKKEDLPEYEVIVLDVSLPVVLKGEYSYIWNDIMRDVLGFS
jgi:hypothetical protein